MFPTVLCTAFSLNPGSLPPSHFVRNKTVSDGHQSSRRSAVGKLGVKYRILTSKLAVPKQLWILTFWVRILVILLSPSLCVPHYCMEFGLDSAGREVWRFASSVDSRSRDFDCTCCITRAYWKLSLRLLLCVSRFSQIDVMVFTLEAKRNSYKISTDA
jgi:hypothetical protein